MPTVGLCFTGIALAFWKDALLSLKGNSAGSSDGTYDLVFSNKTILDPVIRLLCFSSHTQICLTLLPWTQLCLEMRDQLQETGLRVWQQATSIPKDSDNWFTEW